MENQSGGEMFGPMVWSNGNTQKRAKNIKRRSEMNARGFHGDSLTGNVVPMVCCVRHDFRDF